MNVNNLKLDFLKGAVTFIYRPRPCVLHETHKQTRKEMKKPSTRGGSAQKRARIHIEYVEPGSQSESGAEAQRAGSKEGREGEGSGDSAAL